MEMVEEQKERDRKARKIEMRNSRREDRENRSKATRKIKRKIEWAQNKLTETNDPQRREKLNAFIQSLNSSIPQ